MKCCFCDEEARGTCAAYGRGLCHQHAHFHDEFTITKPALALQITTMCTDL
jgi:hypothetical protein